MAFDFRKEYRRLYLPKESPEIVTVPEMNYPAVRGRGNPNEEGGEYKAAVRRLYAVAYTIRMSRKNGRRIEGWFDYVVPPLEGFWHQDGTSGIDYSRKDDLQWISVIRLPDFIKEEDFRWALKEAAERKKEDFTAVEMLTVEEGLCIQCLHTGPYDAEPASVVRMKRYLETHGYKEDLSSERLHHEIYLSDPGRTAPERLKTVIRHPVRQI